MGKSIFLIYHDVYDQMNQNIPRSANIYHVHQGMFLEHINVVKESGIKVTKVGNVMSNFVGESLGFTFDDGWAGLYHYVWPVFKELGWTATVFITQNFVDKPGFLTRSQIVELSNAGFEIGIHGTTHRLLSSCNREEILWELATCKDFLEELTGKPIIYASLPGGDETIHLSSIAHQIGLQAMATSRPGFNFPSTDPYQLRRVPVREDTTRFDVQRYSRFSVTREMLRWFFFQIPHRLLGGRQYALVRRAVLGERKNNKSEIFMP